MGMFIENQTKCYMCVAEHKMYIIKKENGTLPEDMEEPIVEDADTWVPSWQQQIVQNQMVMACVPLPTCERKHLEVHELSSIDKALMGGKILPGSVDQNGRLWTQRKAKGLHRRFPRPTGASSQAQGQRTRARSIRGTKYIQ